MGLESCNRIGLVEVVDVAIEDVIRLCLARPKFL